MSTIYAIANQKGGVGKTTTAVNLAANLASLDRSVLLIDLDPQGNATASLGVDRSQASGSAYDVLLDGRPLAASTVATAVPQLQLLPSTAPLAGAEVELAAEPEREFLLANALNSARDAYDYIFIDCPPSLGLLTVNALAAADRVLVPVQSEYLALEGLAQLIETVSLVRENLNSRLMLFGLIMTMFDGRARLATQVFGEVKQHFPAETFDTYIPRSVRIAEAPSFGEPLIKFDPHSRGAQAYAQLANEFLEREKSLTASRSLLVISPAPLDILGRLVVTNH